MKCEFFVSRLFQQEGRRLGKYKERFPNRGSYLASSSSSGFHFQLASGMTFYIGPRKEGERARGRQSRI